MLKLILTDGHSNLQAIEIQRLEKISLNTPPGTKIRLKQNIPVKSGFAQVQSKHLEVLGGTVEALVEKWEISRKLASFTRAQPTGGDGGGPPPGVPFGKNIGQVVDRGFKAMAGMKFAHKRVVDYLSVFV
jgi:tudor domain-containing protein 3